MNCVQFPIPVVGIQFHELIVFTYEICLQVHLMKASIRIVP
jgi:hypothetical protein